MQPEQLRRTITSQFATSPTLLQLIENLNTCIDPNANLQLFYDQIWNIDTAQGVGLDIWGRIVGVNRVLKVVASPWFGFAEAGGFTAEPFNQGAFYTGAPITSNYSLSDQAYRLLIFAKAALNITNCSIPAINQILLSLFPGRGNAYVADGPNISGLAWFGFAESGDASPFNQAPFFSSTASVQPPMSLTYIFEFPLLPFEVSIVTTSGVLPKPVGVLANYQYLTA